MSVGTRELESPEAPQPVPATRTDPLERALGVVLLIGGAAAVVIAIPTAFHHPLFLAVALSITTIGAGTIWQRSWAMSGMFCLGLLLCSASIGFFLVDGPSLLPLALFFVPGAYLLVVGLRGIVESRRQRA
jgi:energy-converting hydrogenase Eha subunit H